MNSEPVIAFVHGDFGNGESSFSKVAREIGGGYRLILLDRPGFKPESVHPDRYTFAGDASALLDELTAANAGAFHLAAHSYGALVAIAMALQAPERIKSLLLIEPPLLRLLDDPDARAMMQRVRELQLAHRDDDPASTTTAFFEMIGAGHVPERLRGSDDWDLLQRFAPRFARNEPPGDFPVAGWDNLSSTFPVFLYSGGRSHAALQTVTRQLARSSRVSRHTHVPEAGHAVQMAGEPFVSAFLEDVAAAEEIWAHRRPPTPETLS